MTWPDLHPNAHRRQGCGFRPGAPVSSPPQPAHTPLLPQQWASGWGLRPVEESSPISTSAKEMAALGCLKVGQLKTVSWGRHAWAPAGKHRALPWQVCPEACEGHPAGTGAPLPARRRSRHACLSALCLCWLLPQGSHFALDQPGALVLAPVPVS